MVLLKSVLDEEVKGGTSPPSTKKNKKNKTVAPKQKLQLGIFSRSTVRKIDYQ